MSTKIYNGVIFNTDDFFEINNTLMKYKALHLELVKDLVFSHWAKRACLAFDRNHLGLKTKEYEAMKLSKKKLISQVYADIEEEQRFEKTSRIRSGSNCDYSFSITLFPVQSDKKKILGMFFTENRELEKFFLSQDFVSDYHYQNQTDPPDDIKEEEWESRSKDWDIVFDKYSTPKQCGYDIEISSTDGDLFIHVFNGGYKEFLETKLPSIEERIESISVTDYIDHVEGSEILSLSYKEYRDLLEDPVYIEKINKYEEQIRSNIKKDLSMKDLSAEPPNV